MFAFSQGSLENLSSIRATAQRDTPYAVVGPTKRSFALKLVLRGLPCSSNKGRGPQSSIGGHQGIDSEKRAPQANETPSNAPTPREARVHGTGPDRGVGQPRRAAISQNTPGMTMANSMTTPAVGNPARSCQARIGVTRRVKERAPVPSERPAWDFESRSAKRQVATRQ